MQGFLSWWEHSGSTYLTLQLGDGSGADKSWESPNREAAQVPGNSETALIPVGTMLQALVPAQN